MRGARVFSALAVVGVLLWLLWPGRAPVVSSLVPNSSASPRPATSALRRLVGQADPVTQRARVHLDVLDADGYPAAGVRITLGERRGETGADGTLTLGDVPYGEHSIRVAEPWSLGVAYQGPWEVLAPEQHWTLMLQPLCPGPFIVLGSEGEPAAGISLSWLQGEPTVVTDLGGRVDAPNRPCGALRLRLSAGDVVYPHMEALVDSRDPVVLVLPPERAAELLVVYRDEPISADISASRAISVEPLGEGHAEIVSVRAVEQVTVRGEDFADRMLRVPMDGQQHVLEVSRDREVAVNVRCNDCPHAFRCDREPCEGEPPSLACLCPDGPSSIYAQSDGKGPILVGEVASDESEVAFDLRMEGSVIGRWTGLLPCLVEAQNSPTSYEDYGNCAADGSFALTGLRPGAHTIQVGHGGDFAVRVVTLAVGEQVDLGEVTPDGIAIEGFIDAAFPLEGAYLLAFPGGFIELGSDGFFVTPPLPESVTSVQLVLVSDMYGRFETTVSTEESLLWTIDGTRSEDAPSGASVQDTGARVADTDSGGLDSGAFEPDTGSQ